MCGEEGGGRIDTRGVRREGKDELGIIKLPKKNQTYKKKHKIVLTFVLVLVLVVASKGKCRDKPKNYRQILRTLKIIFLIVLK